MTKTENPMPQAQPKAGGGGRGVSYPAISLGEAVNRAKKFWEHERKNAAPLDAAAAHWGYSPSSSGVRTIVAALISYGLMVDKGSGDARQVQLSGRALDIILEAPEKAKALLDAVKNPKIYAELLTEWSPEHLPSDQTIKAHLLRHKNLNPKAADGFIEDFRSSIVFSGIDKTGNMPSTKTSESPGQNEGRPRVKVGDWVQWESGGVIQIQPRSIARISEDGQFVFVDGSDAGIPIDEVKLVESKSHVVSPASGSFAAVGAAPRVHVGFKQDVYNLGSDEGQVILQWPEKMSAESYAELEDWIALQMRKIARLNSIKPEEKKKT
jgi:hypothetical protein